MKGNKILFLALSVILGTSMMFPGNLNKNKKKSKSDIPVVVCKSGNSKKICAPGMPIYGMVYVYDEEIVVELPLSGDMYEITLKNQDNGVVYEGYVGVSGELIIPFGGRSGEYKLDLDSSTGMYVGYFSLD